jgi:hypothetical protein
MMMAGELHAYPARRAVEWVVYSVLQVNCVVKLSVSRSVTMLPTGGYDVYDICYISMLPACDRPVIPVSYLYVIIAIGQMGFSRQLSSAEIFEQVPILDITVTLVVYPFNVYVLLL